MSGAGPGVPDGPDGGAGQTNDACSVPPARLKIRRDFVRASSGGRVHGRSLSLQVYGRKVEDAVRSCPRVGLTVTKKVGNAVERNRVKRRFREALRTPDLKTSPDHDYVIVARREALSAPFSKLVGEVKRCFGDAGAGRVKRSGPPKASGPRRRGSGRTAVPSHP